MSIDYTGCEHKTPLSLVFVLLIGLVGTSVSAQTAIVRGTVTDAETGEYLSGANIVVASAELKIGTVSSLKGRFEIKALPPGTYTVTASYVGFKEEGIPNIVLGAGETKSLDLALRPTVILLNPITVSVSRRSERVIEAPAAVTTLEKSEIERRSVMTPSEHLKGLPAVDVISTGIHQNSIAMRGFNGAVNNAVRLLVFTDHRIASLPHLRFNIYQLIPATNEDIERIEVVSGPASALYGPNAGGGVVHIITQSPFDSKGTVVSVGTGERDLLMGSFRHAGTFNEHIGYKISGQYFRGRDWKFKDPAEPDSIIKGRSTLSGRRNVGGPIPNERDFDVERITGDVRFDFRSTNGFKAILSGGLAGESNIAITDIGAVQIKDWVLGYVQGRFIYKDFFVQAYLNRSDDGDSFFLRSGDIIIDKAKQFVAQIQHGVALLNDRQRFTYGADILLTRPNSKQSIFGRNEDKDDINEIGFFVQSETGLSSKLKLVTTARMDDHNHLDPVFSPRATLSFKPHVNHNFRFTFNRAFESPLSISLFDDFIVVPASNVFPAIRLRGVPPETGYHFRRDAKGGVSGLYMQSIFTPPNLGGPSNYLPADATLMWPVVVAILKQQVDLSALPPPNSRQVGTAPGTLNPNTRMFDPMSPQDIFDIPPLKPRRTTTFEVGYKGVIGNKLLLTTNVYHEKNVDFSGDFMVQTPNVFFDATSLAAYLGQFKEVKNPAALAAGIARIPLGTITPVEGDPADLLITTRALGEVSYYGAESGLEYYTDRNWVFSGNYSYVSSNFFKRKANDPDDRALNTPKHKFNVSVGYENPKWGFNAQLRTRYVDSFPVISGLGRETVPSYTLLDLNVNYRLPFYQNVDLTLSVQNLLNNKHREFISVPKIGRLGMVRLSWRSAVQNKGDSSNR